MRTGSSVPEAAGVNSANGTCGTSLQRGEKINRRRIQRRTSRPRDSRSQDMYTEGKVGRRSLRSWQPDDGTTGRD